MDVEEFEKMESGEFKINGAKFIKLPDGKVKMIEAPPEVTQMKYENFLGFCLLGFIFVCFVLMEIAGH